MIKSLIAPLLFATLVVGIAGHGDDMKKVGKLAFRSIVYFEIVTTLALVVGLVAVNLVRPGDGVGLPIEQVSATITEASQRTVTFSGVLEHIVPSSFVDAAVEERSASGRLLVHHLRGRARAYAGEPEADHARIRREPVAR